MSGAAVIEDDSTACTHVPRGWVNVCRMPGKGEKWVHCPCCGGNGIADENDDLTNPPMICPACNVRAINGQKEDA